MTDCGRNRYKTSAIVDVEQVKDYFTLGSGKGAAWRRATLVSSTLFMVLALLHEISQ